MILQNINKVVLATLSFEDSL